MLMTKNMETASLSVLLLAGFILTSIAGHLYTVSTYERQIKESTIPLINDVVYHSFQSALQNPVTISSLMARDTFIYDWISLGEQDRKSIESYLAAVEENTEVFTSYFVSDKTRQYYHPSGKPRTISEDNPENAWFFKARRMKQDYEVIPSIDEMNNNKPVVFTNHKIKGEGGEFLGLIGVGISFDRIHNLIEGLQQKYNANIHFIDAKGNVVLANEDYDGPLNVHQRKGYEAISKQLISSTEKSYKIARNGKTTFVSSKPLPQFQWRMVIEIGSQRTTWFKTPVFIGNLAISLLVMVAVLILVNLTISSYQRRLEKMATTDQLTGILNRHGLEHSLEKRINTPSARRGLVTVLMIDLDYFKSINDTYGHVVGDRVLQSVSMNIKNVSRNSDIVCRWGGEEFILLLQNCDIFQAKELAERLRISVENETIPIADNHVKVTVSIGIAQSREDEKLLELITRADEILYAAKENGRNRIEAGE